jgi:hypothetical protein
LGNAAYWVVGPHLVPDGVREYASEKSQHPRCRAFSTAHPGQATRAGFYVTGGLPGGHGVAQISDVSVGDCGNGKAAEHRFDVTCDASLVYGQGRCFLARAESRQYESGLGVDHVAFA